MTIYNEQFYLSQQEQSLQSAKQVVPQIMELLNPKSVVDVGCGVSTWLSVFKECGVEIIQGIDGAYVDRNLLHIPKEYFLEHDLQISYTPTQQYDLVVSLEVAEHLSEASSEIYLDTLTKLGKVILFSAAVPHQGGVGHINEQWPDYWIHKFSNKGYKVLDILRPMLWDNLKNAFWYNQNTLLFVKEDYLLNNSELAKLLNFESFQGRALVHPELYFSNNASNTNKIKKIFGTLFANKAFEMITQFDLDIPTASYYVGRAHKELANPSEAEKHLLKYLESGEEDFRLSTLFHLGELYYREAQFKEAEQLFTECVHYTKGQHLLASSYLKEMERLSYE
ncbi:MAG: methyltransferase domain-containing protein [Paenibacillus sp.]|uniref:methyltransferase domain-containing protein n=1 Tax=Paenibacillus sp. TaxID=58172 RepID=UPI00291254B6|nr:methyltransferase domain-containing protein [Paenibacillus sp.]MDU4695593.1 methyltransferase domain-containing protein [Paenibacillus sp.]